MNITINEVDRVEILVLQDNYIDIAAGDSTDIIHRATSLKMGEIKNAILAEHGFSALVNVLTGDTTHNLLFDFGFSEFGAAFNADALNLDMTAIEAMVLSHGHSDHIGGFEQLTRRVGKKNIEFVVHPAVFRSPRYRKITNDFKAYWPAFTRKMVMDAGLTLMETKEPYPLLGGSFLFLGEIPRETDFEMGMPDVYYEENGEEIFDPIEDDTAVVVHLKGKGLVVLSGCAHAGIVNTTKYAMEVTGIDKVHAIMGGFHLTGSQFEPFIEITTEALKEIDPDFVIPTHCTGRNAVNHMEKEMPSKFLLNMAGTKMTFES